MDFLTRYVSGKAASVPKTGDDDTLAMLYSLAAMAGIGGIVLMTSSRRKQQVH